MNDHEQLCDEHGERFTEEELMAKAAEESIAASDAHARATLAADDRAASAAEDHDEHSASEDIVHPNPDEHASPNKGSGFAEDDVVSDDEERLHLAIALNASTTDATKTAASVPKARYNRNGLINGMPTDHVRLLGFADGVQANVHTTFLDDERDDGDKSEDSDSGGEHSNRDHLTASPATKGKRRRQRVIFSKGSGWTKNTKMAHRPSGANATPPAARTSSATPAMTVLPQGRTTVRALQESTEPPLLRTT